METAGTGSRSSVSRSRNIDPSDIQSLRGRVGWDPDSEETWLKTLGSALCVSSVREGGRLVGVGFLVGSPRHAVLCDLCVDPSMHRQGIGRKIAEDLVAAAKEQQVSYVTLTYSEDKPWLKDFYASLGFTDISDAMQLQ